ncbi:MAG: CHAT domain-containing protein [Acidobacteriota bacterium]|nr:CHAT domain-containing protein [Acidobacteriota bacterium]
MHSYQGNYVNALEYFQKALTLREEINNAGGIIDSVNNIGSIHLWEGNYAQALEYYQRSLKLSEKIGGKSWMRDALNNIGEVYRLQGNYAQAMEYSQKSLALSEELGSQLVIPETLNLIGGIYAAQGEHARALAFAERATAIAKQTGSREQLWNARTIAGQSHRALNDLAKARQAFEEAIQVVESIRAGIVGDKARASYFIKAQKLYELYVDLLMELHRRQPSEGHDAAALQASERARMRSLLEILLESHADIRQGVDPALLERERTLRQRLNAAAERQTRLLSDKHTPEQAARVQKEVVELTTSLQDVEAQIRLKSPRYAALTQPVPLNLKEIQQLLDQDTLLLEYALGEDRSYLWAVTRTAIKSYELPKRAEIEKSAKEVYSWLTAGYRGERFIGGQRPSPVAGATSYTEEALRLSRMVFAPVAAQLATKRLLIVSDGVLQYIPFAALPDPAAMNRQGQAGQPLLVNHEIVNLPSASVLAVLRREFATRSPAPKSVAVLADPVFDVADERVRMATASNGTTRGGAEEPATSKEPKVDHQAASSRFILERALTLQPSIGEDGKVRAGLYISRLPFTRRESAAILAAASAGAGMQSLDFRASRLTATSDEISQYRIVHFATHGLLNSEHPELSGIILSLVDEQGRPQDGFLRLHEIYNLHLNAELVVLSACQTGLGKEIKGEGLIGLTRGFMYAGSPRVVASLWKVDDVATAELMKRFYQKMLRDGLRPAAALRAAQVEMWRQPRWQSPYYWAAFQLQGEWK